MHILNVTGLKKVYTSRLGGSKVEALKNVNFTVENGEYVAIMGESGSGKTTLLNILAALDQPTAGTVVLDGQDLAKVRESQSAAFRRDNLGFVFQEFNLLDTFTIEDNIYLPLVLAGKSYKEMEARLAPIAAQLGITDILKKYPYEVSGGQKQRSAVARAIITNPKLVLADEPTAPWTPKPLVSYCGSSPGSIRMAARFSWSPIPRRPPAMQTACCSSGTARCSTRFTGAAPRTISCTRKSPTP